MKNLIALALLAASCNVMAQVKTSYSKIKLKDGSRLHALVVENLPGDYLKVKMAEDQMVKINYEHIASIRNQGYYYQSKFELPRKLYLDLSYAMLFGRSTQYASSRFGMSLSASVNYRFNPHLSFGIGVEPTAMMLNSDLILVPVFVKISGDLKKTRIAPIYSLEAGWSTASSYTLDDNTIELSGGGFIRPGIGIRFNKFVLGLQYQVQKVNSSFENNWWWWNSQSLVEENRTMKNIRLSGTVIF